MNNITMAELVYLNGSFVSKEQARVSIFDHGFLYGDGLFETMRAYEGKVFCLDRHLKRLLSAIRLLRMPISYGYRELEDAVYSTLRVNGLAEAYVRLTVWRGEGGRGLDPDSCVASNVAIIAREFIPYPEGSYKRGFKAVIVDIRQNRLSPLSRLKSLNFLNNILARMEAKARGADEGLMLNDKGHITEGTVCNLFLVLQRRLLTPSLGSGVLPGITREIILEIAKSQGIKTIETEISPSRLKAAEEAFLTNSLMEVMPLTSVDGKMIGTGLPGPVTRWISRLYQEFIRNKISGETH